VKKSSITFDEVFNFSNLVKAYKKCLNGVRWKGSVQRFSQFSITELSLLLEELSEERFDSGHFHAFDIMERGKPRHITSVGIRERVVQRCICDNLLVPVLSSKFIYDNSACVKGKGVHFALKRLKSFLHYCSQDYYILQFDFSKYFDTISHARLIEKLNKIITDAKLMRLLTQLINDFDGDFGLGLGSQISQICALYYPSKIDHFFSSQKKIKFYARYMDDGYMISDDKSYLQWCRNKLIELAANLGLRINERKTIITRLNNKFVFLKARIYLTESNKVIIKPNKKNLARNRRKLRILKDWLEEVNFKQVKTSVLGNLLFFDAFYARKNVEVA